MKDNVTPIRHPKTNVKIYIEQKALDLLESCQNPESKVQQIFYLLGREYHLGLQRVFVVRSILEGSVQEDTAIHVAPEELRSVDQQRSSQYPSLRLIGWALYQPGHGVKALSRHSRCHVQYFRQTSILLLQDPKTYKKELYLWDGSVFQNAGGYQTYQEQELDIDLSDEGTPVELWSEPVSSSSSSSAASGKESMLGRALRDNPESATPLQLLKNDLLKDGLLKDRKNSMLKDGLLMDRKDGLLKDDTPPHLSHYTRKEALPRYTERSNGPRQFEGQLQSIVDPAPKSKSLKQKLTQHRTEAPVESGLHTLSLLTSISAIVLLITVITGALMFHNISTLSTIQTHIETINHRISYIEQSETVIEDSAVE